MGFDRDLNRVIGIGTGLNWKCDWDYNRTGMVLEWDVCIGMGL